MLLVMKKIGTAFKYAYYEYLKPGARFTLRPYYRLRYTWPVWCYILNREARTRFTNNKPRLNPLQDRIVKGLLEDGVFVTNLDELFPNENRLAELQEYMRPLLNNLQPKRKQFLKALFSSPSVLDFENAFIRLSLEEKVLDIINSYMGIYSKFCSFDLMLTIPVGPDAVPVDSQRWHRDPEDRKIPKMHIYLTDVDENSGPFTYLMKSHVDGPWAGIFRQRPPKGYYPSLGGG